VISTISSCPIKLYQIMDNNFRDKNLFEVLKHIER